MLKLSSFLLCVATVFSVLFPAVEFAQKPENFTVEEILRKAEEQRWNYVQEFKNLLSLETKTFEVYDKNGAVIKRRTIKSTFITYQLLKGDNVIAEFRNVIEVDGKPLDNSDKRAQKFFEKIVKAETQAKELKKLQDESLRHDLDILVNGFTLFQSITLVENLRPFFEYRLEDKETINGVEVYVLSFQQIKQSPFISINLKEESQDVKRSLEYGVDPKKNIDYRERLNGRFWINAKTFQVIREEHTMTLQPDGFEKRIPLVENIFEFQKSEFGILTPQKISSTHYELKRKEHTSIKLGRIIFEYERFTKPHVEIKSAEVK